MHNVKFLHHLQKLVNLEQKRVAGNAPRLLNEHKREKDALRKNMLELERQKAANQKLELKINQLKCQLQRCNEETSQSKKKMKELILELVDKDQDLALLQDTNQALIIKERMSNDELQDVHEALIKGLKETESSCYGIIGIKRMAVTTPLLEMNQYNPNGRFIVPELWNFGENRKASPGEVVRYIFDQVYGEE